MSEHLSCRSLAFFRSAEGATLSLTTDKNHFFIDLSDAQVALLLQDSAKHMAENLRAAIPEVQSEGLKDDAAQSQAINAPDVA